MEVKQFTDPVKKEHDRLGQLTKMIRYQNAVQSSGPVEWSWQFDSLGQILRLYEPLTAPEEGETLNILVSLVLIS